ncbi:disease resistance protein RGA4-like [Triticum dicoccoides]|uniref:disease resistance protein RGA4-like n=1 Tax=Triticum dicoccoides TaxID=85692 RepID=UPI001891C6AC|nr:disease resistance protein RGA4-like [Triticum dicoccoides]
MEAVAMAVATAFVDCMVPRLFKFLEENSELRKNLQSDINYIKYEFEMISATIKDEQKNCHDGGEEVHTVWINMVRDLAHAIEDCLDRFTHRVAMAETGAGWLRRAVHRVKTVKARNEFAVAIRKLKKISEDASQLKGTYSSSTTSSPGRSLLSPEHTEMAVMTDDEDEHSAASSGPAPVGMDGPHSELLDLIQQQQQLKVITIVGFHGMGKTLLANHVYKAIESQYEALAWVPPAKLGGTASEVLKEILQQLGQCTDGPLTKLQARIKDCIGTKRFFIVIDDLRKAGYWNHIKVAFAGLSGRFLVTTAIQRIANICSSSVVHDHVYIMTTLADQHSRILFLKEAFQDDDPPPDAEELGSAALKKCDGLPLALVTTARFFQSMGNPTPMKWEKLCADLGTHLENDELFARMRRVLVQSYTSLDSQVDRTFLLYLSTYPSGRPVRKSTLIRKWLAEGFSPGNITSSALDAATSCFDKLVDRSIIQHIDASGNSTEVKTCHTHGMMLEFVIRKSMSDNFVTLLCDQPSAPPLPSKIRRLSLHHARPTGVNDLSLVRSLTVSGQTHPSILDFRNYELMRVLDLGEYDHHLGDSDLKLVCSYLLLLRYLSLGAAVTVLPKNIKKLQLLETLDVRRTKIEILPTQVLELPCLLHLFGKFKLKQDVGDRRMSKLQAWLSANSKLETVAGFVVDSNKSQGFAQLMDHIKHLTKVKICYESHADASSTSTLSKAIKGFIEGGTNLTTHALSLNLSGEQSQDLLNFSVETGKSHYLRSLKLQGDNIFSLPPFVTMLVGLNKLCLSFPHQLRSDIIAALSGMRSLKQLKLTATQLDKHIIGKGAFKILQHLWITVEVMAELDIEDGALPCLKSLRLLCKNLDGFSGTSAIEYFKHLKEIALHREVGDATKHEWKEAARKHPRCPKILFV